LGHEVLEIAEAMLLAVVAITTAWSGYQSALWAGHQSELYGQASKLRVQAALAGRTRRMSLPFSLSGILLKRTKSPRKDQTFFVKNQKDLRPGDPARPEFAPSGHMSGATLETFPSAV
jgi:hypothetical protein